MVADLLIYLLNEGLNAANLFGKSLVVFFKRIYQVAGLLFIHRTNRKKLKFGHFLTNVL